MSVTGTAEVLANLRALEGKMTAQLVKAVEDTDAAVANAAKKNHGSRTERPEGIRAHAMGRYQDQTKSLTASIIPQDVEVTVEAIIGRIMTDPKEAPGSDLEYAAIVERRFPYMVPALMGEKAKFEKRVAAAMKKAMAEKL